MTAIHIVFSGDPREQLDHEEVLQKHREFIREKLVPFFLKRDWDFRFIHYNERLPEAESPYRSLHLVVKCHWDNESERVKDFLRGVSGVTYTDYPDCNLPDCYEPVATHGVEKLRAPLFDRYGNGEPHDSELYCRGHLCAADRAILRSIETLDEPPPKYARGDAWIKITIWRHKGRWYAQRTQNDWDGDWEHGYQEYCYGSPWQCGQTREEAIEKARAWE